jgi:outer membrane receptor protein involved in Fe transport
MIRRSLLLAVLIPFSLAAATPQEIAFQIVDSEGAAVPGASLEVRRLGAPPRLASGVTNAQGRWAVTMDLPLDVRVTAPGFEPLHARVENLPADAVRLSLAPATLHTTLDVVVRDSPATTATIEQTALEIDRTGARTVFDAVERLVPSAYVSRRGVTGFGLGQSGTFTLRGLGGSPTTQLLVVVDGRPDFMGLMGHPLADCYTLTDVGSLSVTTGPASVLYGSNAMAGAVEVKPTHPLPGMHTSLVGSLGSFYTGQYRLTNGGQWGRRFYHLTAGVAHTNGHRPESAFRNQDGTLAAGYEISPVWRTSLRGRYGHFYVEDPGNVQAPVADSWARVGRGGLSWDLDNRGSRTWGMARVFASFGHHMLHDGFRSVDNSVGARVVESFLVGPQVTLDAGTDIIRYGGRARDISPEFNYGEFHINDAAGFTRVRYAASGKLLLNAGLRYDHDSHSGGITVPEFGATYRLAERFSLSASASRGFRNPTIRELFLFPAPTPTLQPERLWNYQATFQVRPARTLLAWVTGYYADADNLILTTGAFPNLRLENSGKTINKGLEAHARWQPVRRASLNAAYAHLHSTDLAPYSPQNRMTYSLDLDAQRLFLTLGGTTVGRTFSGARQTLPVSGYTIVNLKCTAPLGEHTSLFVMVDNLFNRRYEVISGYVMPGANAAAGFDLKF